MPTEPAGKIPLRRAFLQPAAWTLFFFGFSSGLPFLLPSVTLAYWLKEQGIELSSITMISSAGMTYALKFLWAPLLDRWRLPGLGRLGLRRGWLVLAQGGVVAGLLAMAWLTPAQLAPFVFATLAVAFFGATQDVAVDAYRIEIAPPAVQGALFATYALGYRMGLILAGAVALILADHWSWSAVYVLMAAAMAIPLVAVLLAREPELQRVRAADWRAAMRLGVVEPFADFFRRFDARVAIALLVFILLYKTSDQALIGGVIGPFYLDQGYSKTQIGAISKIYGIWVGLGGVLCGAIAVARWGVTRAMGIGIVAGALSNLLYLTLIGADGDLLRFALVISGENFAQGFLGTAGVAYLSALVSRHHTATQYALFSSLVALPGKLLGFWSGGIVEAVGYGSYFVITTVAILPAWLLFVWLRPRLALEPVPGGAR